MIRVEHISFFYPDEEGRPRKVLDDVSLRIGEGETVAVMGRNGSGNTTFARCLNGLLLPGSGRVCVDELCTASPGDLAEIRRRVGMVFQNPDNQIVSATVEREIAFGLENLGVPYERMHEIVDEMLVKFNVQAHRHRPPHHLSGGEKQRLALAAVSAMEPRCLVLDEPTSLLDPKSRREVLQYVQELRRHDLRMTVILITQFPDEALLADRLIIFHEGRVAADGRPEAVFSSDLERFGLEAPISFQALALLREYGIDIDIELK